MQNAQMAPNMAAMNAGAVGPIDGAPMMGNMQRPRGNVEATDPRSLINTYIYDYFLRNNHHQLAETMLKSEMKLNIQLQAKQSPGSRNVNGVDAMDADDKISLPLPNLPSGQAVDNSFLLDWWNQFWDIFSAARNRPINPKAVQYTQAFRTMQQQGNDQRQQRMMMNANGNGMAQFNMMNRMSNGVAPNDLKRAAAMNRNPNGAGPMANMGQMKNPAMMGAQMQRDGSQMDMNGQRPQSPGSVENAPSPNKRPRVEGAMNAAGMAGNQFGEFAQGQNVQQKSLEGMNPGAQGSPMNPGLEGQEAIFAGNQPRPGMPPAAGQPQGNHALQDYQMQLMLLEQQNKKRLLMARQEQDNMSAGPHSQPGVGGPGYPPAMSPQGTRAGPSPNPADQMKRGTPKLNQPGLPGSPMPDASMQAQRSSPAPNGMVNFDPTGMPPGMPPQLGYPQMQQSPMMRPPSSHPGFNGQQLNPQQLEAMRQNGVMANGAWRGPGGPQGMMQGPGQQMGGPMPNPQQRNQQMPPPPAPPAGEQPRPEPSPSQPAAPPTPSQASKPNPKKKPTKDNKKPSKAKGANTGATPAASGEDPPPTPTPSTPIAPITPMNPKSFAMNGQQAAQPPAQPQQSAPVPQPQPQPPMDPPFGSLGDEPLDMGFGDFGTEGGLENFDFDSFLHVEDPTGLNFTSDFDFANAVEAGGDL